MDIAYLIKPNWLIKDYKIGETITIPKDCLSGHGLRIINFFKKEPKIKVEIEQIIRLKQDITDDFINKLSKLEMPDSNLSRIIKELLLEKIRREKFPDKPSRFESIFLSDQKRISKWVENLNGENTQIFKLQCSKTYNVHTGNENIWHENDDWELSAEKYWKNEFFDKFNTLNERVFQGKLTVIDIYNDYNDFKNRSYDN